VTFQVDVILSQVGHFALTSDGWTANNGSKFIVITLHTFFQNNLLSLSLSLPQISFQSAAALASSVRGTLESHNLHMDRVSAMTTDGAANMLALCNDLQLVRSPCVAHLVQLFLKKVLSVRDFDRFPRVLS